MNTYQIIRVALLILTGPPTFAQQANHAPDVSPQVFHVTTARTLPGEAVLVRGEYLDQISKIEVSRLPDDNVRNATPGYIPLPHEDQPLDLNGTDKRSKPITSNPVTVDRLLQNAQSVKFIIPSDWLPGVYSVQLTDKQNNKTSFYINVPIVNWVISEEGLKAIPGDYLRVQGKNLLRNSADAQVVLIGDNNTQVVRTRITKAFDDYSVSVNIPANVQPGKYHLYYHNGYGGKTAWSEPLLIDVTARSPNKYAKDTFNVQQYGAKGDGINNETAAFRAALDAAEKHGGGTVYVPRGRYILTGELILSPHTLLKGQSQEQTQLVWSALNWDMGELPANLISGTHDFAIKDLNIWATRAWGLIQTTGPVNEMGNVTLENLVIRQTPQMGGQLYALKANRDSVELELNSKWNKTGIILRGQNIKVRNCDFNSTGMYTFAAVSGFIQHTKFQKVTTGVNQPYMAIHPKGLIFEDCYRQGDGFGYAATIDESRDLYEARNITPYDYTNDREVMTLDGGSGAYAGKISGIRNNTLALPPNAATYQWSANKWVGGGLFILSGKGAGQYRRILRHTLDSITVDLPFLVDPDTSSIISITTVRKNLYYVNNEIFDGGAYQLYGSAQGAVLAGLKMTRCSGIVSRGSFLYHGKQPNWYVDIVDCELREGNYSHWFGTGDRHSGNQSITLIGNGGSGMNIGTLVRRNKLYDFSYIRTSPGVEPGAIADVIIENNNITTAHTAIQIGGAGNSTSNVLIHNNHYSDIEKAVEINPGLQRSTYLVMDEQSYRATAESYPEETLGWFLGAQTYTFNKFPFFDAIRKVDSCNLKYVEAYPGQPLGGGLEGNIDYKMEAAKRVQVLQRLKEAGVTLKAFGVVKCDNEADWRQLFEFGKSMGIQTFTAEPRRQFIPFLSKLCDEYKINMAIHNHAEPSPYWHPDTLLAVLKGQSKRIGACADIGHWVRSGLDPLDCLKKLDGRVLQLHLKDLNEKNNKKAHDVIWGTGVSGISSIINELKRQRFKGMISVEYEYNWFNNVPDIIESVAYFRNLLNSRTASK
ncbi:hypothetical protein D3H65_01985 [Paraflavitalea soli]|uniref:Pectate lyase superfamily protein domain-containing protein n=1 Tax=Paraflavitalea soli TaxID=2315862 RepID=A0A3B7MI00_9BACT|nr:glycosyl hydrolase family 28-related protein [Paraflavitalea soli]AXY72810.1 hypothetical protein D3H65_01985 [Paraflavitalea soli]